MTRSKVKSLQIAPPETDEDILHNEPAEAVFQDIEIKEESDELPYTNPIKAYLKEVKALPLLSLEEEIILAKKIKNGDKEARIKLIQANLRLVISVAKRYTHMGLPLSDLIEEGNLGLMKAVDRYDPTRGYRFSTYATWWIKQSIMRALANQGKTIRVPVYLAEIMGRLRKANERLAQKLGRAPSDRELSKVLKTDVKKIKMIKNITTNPSSLESPIGEGGTGQLINLIADEGNVSPLTELSLLIQHERITALLERLSSREAEIISLRFGLNNQKSFTLEETGHKFGITRERVRQIEAAVIKKIKIYYAEAEKGLKRPKGEKNDQRKIKRKNKKYT